MNSDEKYRFPPKQETLLLISIYLLGCIFILTPQTNILSPKVISTTFSFAFYNILFLISWIDMKTFLISNNLLSLGFILGGIVFLIRVYDLQFNTKVESFLYLVIESLICFAIIFLVNKVGQYLVQVNLLGIGDAKLASMCTIWIGGEGIFSALMIAFLTAGFFSLCKKIIKNTTRYAPIPFAPFISGGVWCVWITGSNSWWNYFQDLFGYLMV